MGMKQYKIPIPDKDFLPLGLNIGDYHIRSNNVIMDNKYRYCINKQGILELTYIHANYLGYWRNDNPDFTKGYVYLWDDGEITYADDEIVVDFEVIQWDDFMLLKREV